MYKRGLHKNMTRTKLLEYIPPILGMAGAISLALKLSVHAQIIWAISNPSLIIYNYYKRDYKQAAMFAVYEAVTLYGIYNWIHT